MARDSAHIAVVEDDASVRKALARLLVAAGFAVKTFASAEEFLARIEEGEVPACLLLDAHLPRMGGLELHRRLVSLACPVSTVFITADYELARSKEMHAAGVTCLMKPIDEEVLLQAIGRATAHPPLQ
jgi:FixJ family two-component response regulator